MGLLDKLFGREQDEEDAGPFDVESFSELNRYLKDNRCVVVEFWMRGCSPCKAMDAIVKRLAKEYRGKVMFLKSHFRTEIADKYKVKSVPTFLLFVDGKVRKKKRGAMSYEAFKNWMSGCVR